jgi:hypothetical protein
VDLNSFLPNDSGWTLYGASAINDSGQIVGTGIHNGLTEAFIDPGALHASGSRDLRSGTSGFASDR